MKAAQPFSLRGQGRSYRACTSAVHWFSRTSCRHWYAARRAAEAGLGSTARTGLRSCASAAPTFENSCTTVTPLCAWMTRRLPRSPCFGAHVNVGFFTARRRPRSRLRKKRQGAVKAFCTTCGSKPFRRHMIEWAAGPPSDKVLSTAIPAFDLSSARTSITCRVGSRTRCLNIA